MNSITMILITITVIGFILQQYLLIYFGFFGIVFILFYNFLTGTLNIGKALGQGLTANVIDDMEKATPTPPKGSLVNNAAKIMGETTGEHAFINETQTYASPNFFQKLGNSTANLIDKFKELMG